MTLSRENAATRGISSLPICKSRLNSSKEIIFTRSFIFLSAKIAFSRVHGSSSALTSTLQRMALRVYLPPSSKHLFAKNPHISALSRSNLRDIQKRFPSNSPPAAGLSVFTYSSSIRCKKRLLRVTDTPFMVISKFSISPVHSGLSESRR